MSGSSNPVERLPDPNLKATFCPHPTTSRGSPSVIGVHPKEPKIVYCTGKLVVVRDLANPADCLLYKGHNDATTVAKFSPNGYWVASADIAGKVRVWSYDNPEHTLKVEVPVFAGEVKDLSWDPESKRIVAVGDGRTVSSRVFMWDTGNSIGEIVGHMKRIMSVDYKPTRPFRILTASEDSTIRAFEGPPFKFKHSIPAHSNFANCVRYSPDGIHAVSVGSDKGMVLYDAKSSEKLASFPVEHAVSIYSVAWSPDSKQLLTASGDKTVKLWDVGTMSVVTTFTFGSGAIEDMQVAVVWVGDFLVSLSLSGDLNYLDVTRPDTPLRVVQGHQVSLQALAVDADTGVLVTGSYDGAVVAWHATSGRRFTGAAHTAKVTSIDVHRGIVASGGWDDVVRFGSVVDTAYSGSVGLNGAQPSDVALATHAASGAVLCAVATNKGVKLLVNGALAFESSATATWTPTSVAMTPSGEQVALGGDEDRRVHVFHVVSNGETWSLVERDDMALTHNGSITTLAYSPDGTLLAVGDAGREVRVWDAKDGSLRVGGQWVHHTTRISTVAWNPSGTHVASGASDEHIFVWNVDQPANRHKFENAHRDGVMSVKFVADDQLVSVGNDAAIHTWQVPSV
ncbi:hypothetical protein H310_13211 [Aphanomyces invadans]|uniref:Uncharacterized protein n=1 Tax=Aphanomyces invadans TaxID=157072 RepID=A0A024TGT1_9STRA|nr:hypothetical protein H310_13211 [Aphanomyces invadans]ETV92547.1 hypothetical protein H310_13211 [Aphanomyces invadans]|eukprot:XP_008878854.1 hypothetical protein H310_13211 [Aphanomyces invadans]